jgi:hypothetical protein
VCVKSERVLCSRAGFQPGKFQPGKRVQLQGTKFAGDPAFGEEALRSTQKHSAHGLLRPIQASLRSHPRQLILVLVALLLLCCVSAAAAARQRPMAASAGAGPSLAGPPNPGTGQLQGTGAGPAAPESSPAKLLSELLHIEPIEITSLGVKGACELGKRFSAVEICGPWTGALVSELQRQAISAPWPLTMAFVLSALSGVLGPGVKAGVGPRAGKWKQSITVWAAAVAATASGKTPALTVSHGLRRGHSQRVLCLQLVKDLHPYCRPSTRASILCKNCAGP